MGFNFGVNFIRLNSHKLEFSTSHLTLSWQQRLSSSSHNWFCQCNFFSIWSIICPMGGKNGGHSKASFEFIAAVNVTTQVCGSLPFGAFTVWHKPCMNVLLFHVKLPSVWNKNCIIAIPPRWLSTFSWWMQRNNNDILYYKVYKMSRTFCVFFSGPVHCLIPLQTFVQIKLRF